MRQSIVEMVYDGMTRWSVQEIAKGVVGQVVGEGKRLTHYLLRRSVHNTIAEPFMKRAGRELAKNLESVVTEAPGTAEERRKLAGALGTNLALTAAGFGDAAARLAAAQGELELVRGKAGEAEARAAREAAEERFIRAFADLGRLADGE